MSLEYSLDSAALSVISISLVVSTSELFSILQNMKLIVLMYKNKYSYDVFFFRSVLRLLLFTLSSLNVLLIHADFPCSFEIHVYAFE